MEKVGGTSISNLHPVFLYNLEFFSDNHRYFFSLITYTFFILVNVSINFRVLYFPNFLTILTCAILCDVLSSRGENWSFLGRAHGSAKFPSNAAPVFLRKKGSSARVFGYKVKQFFLGFEERFYAERRWNVEIKVASCTVASGAHTHFPVTNAKMAMPAGQQPPTVPYLHPRNGRFGALSNFSEKYSSSFIYSPFYPNPFLS